MKGLLKTVGLAAILLSTVYIIIQVVGSIGVLKVLTFLYVLLGFMVAVETADQQNLSLKHPYFYLTVLAWLPMVVYGLSKRGWRGYAEKAEKSVA